MVRGTHPTRSTTERRGRYDGLAPRLFASSSSITSLNFSNGCAPESMRPLMKNAGVPVTPTSLPSAMSLSMPALNCCLDTHSSNLARSRPTSAANACSFSGDRSGLAKSLSWYSQNLPCASAQRAASAAGRACAWNGQREVAVHEAHLVAVGLHDLLHRHVGALAERTLVVGELDHGHRRIRPAATRRPATGADLDHGWLQRHLGLVLLLQLVDERFLALFDQALLLR